MDTWTGTAGDDTVNATVATLGSLDVIDAGAGTNDTLNISETNSITTWGGAALTGFETAKVSTTGNIGAIKVSAAATTPGTPQVKTLVSKGTWTSGDLITVTIGSTEYEAQVLGTTFAHALDAVRTVLNAHLADTVTVAASSDDSVGTASATMTITAASGWSLPTISVAKKTYANTSTPPSVAFSTAATAVATSADGAITTTAAITQSNPVALKQAEKIKIGDTSTTTSLTLSVDGADYTSTFAATDEQGVAVELAALVNSVLGAGSATVADTTAADVVTITSLTAGTKLPALNLIVKAGATVQAIDSWTHSTANIAANTAAVSAATLAAPTGVTSYTASATGVANVSGASTTNITASGTVVQTSVGKDVTVTASDSVFVSGAKGAVVVTAGKSATTISGAVPAESATGTATDAAGVYVTGGTTVTITGTKDTGAVQVGAKPYAKDAVSTTGYPQTNGNSSKTPTGDVSITNVSLTADTTTGASIGTYNSGAATVYTNGASTVTVKGAGTTIITDANTLKLKSTAEATEAAGTSKLATVNLAGITGATTITSDAISTISVTDTASTANRTVTVSNSGTTGANTGAINLAVSNVGRAVDSSTTYRVTLDDSTATSVNVSSAAASAYATVGAVTANSGSKSYITLTTPKATSVTMTNSLAVDIGDTTAAGMAKVATINASGATGAVTATVGTTGSYGLTFTGGSGADSVTLKAGSTISAAAQEGVTVKTSISLGAGNDKLLNGGTATSSSATVSTGAVVDGGDGTDTVSASLINVDNAAQFTNFEIIDIKGGASGGSLDASLLTGSTITGVAMSGDVESNGAFSVTKIKGTDVGVTITDTGNAGSSSLTATLATSTGTADTATIVFNAASSASSTASVLTLFKTTGIETMSVASGGALATSAAKVANEISTIEDSSNTTSTITITGTQNFTMGAFLQNNAAPSTTAANVAAALKTIDGSAATGVLTITAGSDDPLANNSAVSTVFDGLIITGGSGADVLRNDAKGGVVNGGAGNDTIRLSAAATASGVKSSANGGDGDDTLIVAAAVSTTLTGGAGKDTFDASLAYSSTLGSVITTVTDYTAGSDTIKITGSNSLTKAATTSGTYSQLLSAADTEANGNSKAVWFQFDGNTYLVGDNAASYSSVVKLVGLFNLTSATATTGLIGEA